MGSMCSSSKSKYSQNQDHPLKKNQTTFEEIEIKTGNLEINKAQIQKKQGTVVQNVAVGNLEKKNHIDISSLFSDKKDNTKVYNVKAYISSESQSANAVILMDLDLYNKHRENAKKLLLCILSDFKDYFLHEDSNKSNKEFLYIRLIAYNNKTIYDPIVYKFEQTEEMLNELDRLSQRNDAETELKGEINAINKIHTTSLPGQSTFVFHFCNGFDEKNDHVSNNEVSSDIREIDELKYEIIFLSESNKNDKVCEKLSNLIDFDVSVL